MCVHVYVCMCMSCTFVSESLSSHFLPVQLAGQKKLADKKYSQALLLFDTAKVWWQAMPKPVTQ